jgi:hypothetical protein
MRFGEERIHCLDPGQRVSMTYFRSSERIRQALLASWCRGPCVAPWWPGAVPRCVGAAGLDGDVAGVEPAGLSVDATAATRVGRIRPADLDVDPVIDAAVDAALASWGRGGDRSEPARLALGQKDVRCHYRRRSDGVQLGAAGRPCPSRPARTAGAGQPHRRPGRDTRATAAGPGRAGTLLPVDLGGAVARRSAAKKTAVANSRAIEISLA